MAVPLLDKKIVKKRVKKFKRHQSDRFISVKVISYSILLIRNTIHSYWIGSKLMWTALLFPFDAGVCISSLLVLCDNWTYCAEIAHNVSTKKKDIVERAAQLDIVVTNKLARLRSQEDDQSLEIPWRTLSLSQPTRPSTFSWFPVMEALARRRLALFASHVSPPAGTSLPTCLSASACASDTNGDKQMKKGDSSGCVFCKIIGGEAPAVKLYEDDECLCILDTYPLCHGHSLIIPKCHFPSLAATPPSKNNKYWIILTKYHGLNVLTRSHFVKSAEIQIPLTRSIMMQIIAAMCSKVPLISNAVMKATGCDSFNLLVNNGAAAGQVIYHTHIHIIPRKAHDCLWTSESLPRRWLKLDQEASQLANRIRESIVFVNNYESDDSKGQASSLVVN
ncbi:UNVERIFIED_CONTAM: Adenylylsulfatase HINT3 [Sesamum calycinum]|uniref:Adenylylsulfatase HINT3 n=1 Tax=Sesamum calycinum TaxID=2727403 RepID=A0AAW2SDW2_9LAMI